LGGSALSLATETDDKGTYNAERVVLRNCLFRNVEGAALDLYRGGKDESTFGPFLAVDHCTFDHVGNGSSAALKLTGVQWSDIKNCLFVNSAASSAAISYADFGKADNSLSNSNFYRSGQVAARFPPRTTRVTYLPTAFLNAARFDYRLQKSAAPLPAATDGRPVGFLPRQ